MNKDFVSIGLGYLSQDDLLRWLKQYTESTATIYDNAMDAVYNSTKEHGNIHRLFDGGHDPLGAWDAVKNASETDSFTQEFIGYVSAMVKDMSTVEGMPFFKYDREWYNETSNWLASNIPGASKDWLKDLMTYDSFEIFSSTLSVVAVVFHLKNDDVEALSRTLGSMAIISIMGANPLMGMAVVTLSAYAFIVKKNKLDTEEMLKGMAVSGTACIVFTALGLPVIIELIIFVAIMEIIKKRIISSKEIQKRLYDLAYGHSQLVPLMIGAEAEYRKLLSATNVTIEDAKNLSELAENDLEERKDKLDLLKKMK